MVEKRSEICQCSAVYDCRPAVPSIHFDKRDRASHLKLTSYLVVSYDVIWDFIEVCTAH